MGCKSLFSAHGTEDWELWAGHGAAGQAVVDKLLSEVLWVPKQLQTVGGDSAREFLAA